MHGITNDAFINFWVDYVKNLDHVNGTGDTRSKIAAEACAHHHLSFELQKDW